MQTTHALHSFIVLTALTSAALTAHAVSYAGDFLSPVFTGATATDGWYDLNTANFGPRGSFGTTNAAWSAPLGSNQPGYLTSVASNVLYSPNALGTFTVTDPTPVAGLANVLFQLSSTGDLGPTAALLSFDGGTQNLAPTLATLIFSGGVATAFGPATQYVWAYQWDVTPSDILGNIAITWTTAASHNLTFGARLDQSDTFAAVIPEPSTTAALAGLSVLALTALRRRTWSTHKIRLNSTMTTTEPPTRSTLTPADQARILDHMNADHRDAVLAYARHLGARPAATAATLASLDARGMELVVTEPTGDHAVRIAFSPPLTGATDAHHTLVRLAKEATAALRAATPATPAPDAKQAAALERARAAVVFLRDTLKTIQLGTASSAGEPDCSVAPFVLSEDGALHVYISNLSLHTANLRANPRASALLIEDEATANHLLARRRLTLHCTATFVARDDAGFAAPMQALREKFGPVMEHLVNMHDFHLVRLTPERARLVAGFGQAYDADPADWTRLSHVNDTGHSHAPAAPKS